MISRGHPQEVCWAAAAVPLTDEDSGGPPPVEGRRVLRLSPIVWVVFGATTVGDDDDDDGVAP